jgi:hypothetical protein
MLPMAIVVADCLTEPLGGVPIWSLINNEGPVILIVGGVIGLISFGVGRLLNVFARYLCQSAARIKPPGSSL